eukprot:3743164-Rhodomonas_salina.1
MSSWPGRAHCLAAEHPVSVIVDQRIPGPERLHPTAVPRPALRRRHRVEAHSLARPRVLLDVSHHDDLAPACQRRCPCRLGRPLPDQTQAPVRPKLPPEMAVVRPSMGTL